MFEFSDDPSNKASFQETVYELIGDEPLLCHTENNSPSASPTTSDFSSLSFEDFQSLVLNCSRCPLHQSRTQVVFGQGHLQAQLMFVGEAPGRDEDKQGQAFVGRAGKLLTKMIEAMGLSREQIYIANVLKCRPPQNRNPLPEEISKCSGFLYHQIRCVQPRVICALGTFASQTLLKTDQPISQLRNKQHSLSSIGFDNIICVPSYHPAYLLRNPSAKKYSWEDLKTVMKILNLPQK